MDEIDLLAGLPGLRDYYPEDWKQIEYVLNRMREVSKAYGYLEYEGPSIEPVELIEAKSGEGLMKEIFSLSDRNDRRLLLRPEQTPTLARMLAKEQQRYKKPLRWFSIPRLFRDETIQKGRTREFWQLNVDILGEDSLVADAEAIAVGIDIVRACGINDDEFNVYINHRGLLNNYISSVTDVKPSLIIPVIDKKMSFLQDAAEAKLREQGQDADEAKANALLLRRIANSSGAFKQKLLDSATDEVLELLAEVDHLISEEMSAALAELGVEPDNINEILSLIDLNGSPSEFLSQLKKRDIPDSCQGAVDDLEKLAIYLESYDVTGPVVFDASMARGLDYYTGVVFEAFDATGEIVRAIFGGGRYSDLVEIMGGSPLTGVGFGMGETVIMELMKLRGVFDTIEAESPDIYLAPIKDDPIPELISLGQRLRSEFDVLCNPFSWKLGRHFELADDMGATLVLLMGQRDLDNGVVSIREMASSEQHTFDYDQNLEEKLRELLDTIE